ncbi:MAG: hypothetical protein JNL54_03380 [Kineosporiaceae bacterium]|nr:hypothetical protein [Kineosporiaceae bacterium]
MGNSAITPAATAQVAERVAAAELIETAGAARLLIAVGRPESAQVVLSALQTRIRSLVTAGAVALMLAVGLVVAPAATPAAQAAIVAAQATTATQAGQFTTVKVTVGASKRTRAGTYLVSLWHPTIGLVGSASSAKPTMTITAVIPTAILPAGTSTWTLRDEADGRWSSVKVTVLRQTVLSVPRVQVAGFGLAWVTVSARHYTTAGYRGSAYSPVLVQRWTGTSWRTVRTLTTDASGTATGIITSAGGTERIRVVRPVGATVTGATTGTVTAQVPAPAGEGCIPCSLPAQGA